MLWIAILVLTAAVLFVTVQPFFRTYDEGGAINETDYLASQILEIDRDLENGVLSEEEAEAARNEARRRLLSQKRRSEGARPKVLSPAARQAGAMLAVAAPLGALVLYSVLGAPGYDRQGASTASVGPSSVGGAEPARGQSGGLQSGEQAASDMSEAAVQLRRRLEAEPDDVDGWTLLGRTYAALEDFSAAADAFSRAAALAPETASHYAAQGEALVAANNGAVTETARTALDKALEIDPQEPRARYYKARYIYQTGDKNGALQALVALANGAPDSAAWLPVVRDEIVALAAETGVAVEGLGLAASSTSAPETIEALETELAAGDAPYTVWIALVNAYRQSGDEEKAKETLQRAEERYAAAPFVLQELAKLKEIAAPSGDTGRAKQSSPQPSVQRRGPNAEQVQAAQALNDDERASMIEGMVAGLEARLESEPDDLEGWMMLGRSFGVLGDHKKSADAYARAIALAPENIDSRIAYAQALLTQLDLDQKPIDDKTQSAIRDVIALDPDQPFALYFLGLAAQQDGDASQARTYWTKLLSQLPEGSPDAERIKGLIQSL